MSKVISLKASLLCIPRDEPYLCSLNPDEIPNAKGYFVRKKNRTVYNVADRTVILRLETDSGVVGWGETYGLIAPTATLALLNDFIADYVVGRDPFDASVIHDDLYNMMRVRGYHGGYYMDALAAVDIALWDAAGKMVGLPVAKLLGGRRRTQIPAYVSGLPKSTLAQRVAFAQTWAGQGFDSFKFATPAAGDDLEVEMSALRAGLGPKARIACDMHWAQNASEAIVMIKSMERHGLWFAEAPVPPEDIRGLAQVAAAVHTPVAGGEEWRSVYDAQARFDADAVHIVQPEMGHTGITQFMRIGLAAQARHLTIMPHATIGAGIFLAASLQASCALDSVTWHEFQHSIFNRNTNLITAGIECSKGAYRIGDAPGIGVELTNTAIAMLA